MIILNLLLAISQSLTHAQTNAPYTSYACHLMLIAKDLPNGSAEFNFQAEADGGDHGGTPREFTVGANKLGVISDGKWLVLSWERAGKPVASGTSIRSEPTRAAVLIIADPLDQDQQLSVDCSANVE